METERLERYVLESLKRDTRSNIYISISCLSGRRAREVTRAQTTATARPRTATDYAATAIARTTDSATDSPTDYQTATAHETGFSSGSATGPAPAACDETCPHSNLRAKTSTGLPQR